MLGIATSGWCEDDFKTVSTDGSSIISNDNSAKARDYAMEDALKKAVGESIESMVSSNVIEDNREVIKENILVNSNKYINNYRVISEKSIGNIFQVSMDVTVNDSLLSSDLYSLGLLYKNNGLPFVLFMIWELNIHNNKRVYWWADTSELAEETMSEMIVTNNFKETGFNPVDHRMLLDKDRDLLKSELLSNEDLLEYGRKYGAHIVVYGRAATTGGLERNEKFALMRFQGPLLSLIAVDVNRELPLAGVGLEKRPDSSDDFNKFMEMKTVELSKKLIDDIINSLDIETEKKKNIIMIIRGIKSYVNFVNFKDKIANNIKSVKNISQKSFSAGKANLEIELAGTVQKLADDLTFVSFDGFSIDITELDGEMIKINMKPLD